jgi:hypothetical protein
VAASPTFDSQEQPIMGGVNSCLNRWLDDLRRKDNEQELSLLLSCSNSLSAPVFASGLNFPVVSGVWNLSRVLLEVVVATPAENRTRAH